MSWQIWSVVPVWVLAIASAVVIAVVVPREQYLTWVSIALAGALIVTFAIQLSIQRKDGFVLRAMASVGVSVLILAVASGIVALLG